MKEIFDVFKKKTCEKLGKQTGFIKRKRNISAFDFLVMMTLSIAGMIHPSLAAMIDAVSVKVKEKLCISALQNLQLHS